MSLTASLRSALFKLTPSRLESYLRRERYYRVVRDRAPDPDLQRCCEFLKPGDTVIDVGANIGLYAKAFSECVGPQGRVHALEPVPETFGYLSHNVKKFGLQNVSVYNIAATDVSGDSRMSIPRMEAGFTNIYEARLDQQGDIPVQVRRLDDMFSGSKPVLIKIDVEGHEAEVLRGAEALLRKYHPALAIEVTSPDPEKFLATIGYRRIDDGTGHDQFFVYGQATAESLG